MEKSGLSVCMPACVCVCVCARTCTCIYVCATEGSGAAVCSTGWQGGCQNGPVSCVSSKIGPNTAEMHDTLWLFTALTQCVRRMLPSVWNQTHSVLYCICSQTEKKDVFILKNIQCDGRRKKNSLKMKDSRLRSYCGMFYASQ